MKAAFVLALATGAVALPLLKERASISASDLANLKLYAEYSAASYCNSEVSVGTTISCSNGTCPTVESRGSKVLATINGVVSDATGYVTTDSTAAQIIVAFQGTSSLRNWITNLQFAFSSCDLVSDCKVHTGFGNAWDEISSSVLAAVASAAAAHPTYTVVTTGHSLGAALATLAGTYLREEGYAVDIYTYGSPRVGNDKFADFVTNQTGAEFRVTHLNDLVPRLPPIFLGYRHTSPEYWLSTGDATTISYTVNDIKICTGNANTGCNGSDLFFDTEAHLYYFEALAGCSTDSFGLKRDVSGLELDQEVIDRLNAWAELDRQFSE